MRGKENPVLLQRPFFIFGSLTLAFVFALLSYWLYLISNKSAEFLAKLGEYALQISILVLAGAAVKEFVDWRNSIKLEADRNKELRGQFLQRLREAHVKILYSRDLMRAHRSAKTWSEQSRNLIQIIAEIEEISEDLQTSPQLFPHQDIIIYNIEGIISYLAKGRKEYIEHHNRIDASYKEGIRLTDAIRNNNMQWTNDFMEGSGIFMTEYATYLRNAKTPMRKAVFTP